MARTGHGAAGADLGGRRTRLIGYERQAHWLHDADLHTRQTALSLIDDVIVKLREENGYAPIDDSCPVNRQPYSKSSAANCG